MTMRFRMDIGDFFTMTGKGIVIAGVNPDLDALGAEKIKAMIPNEVRIARKDGQHIEAPVLGIDMAYSILDKVNIFILVPLETDSAFLEIGGSVCAVSP